MHIYFCNCIPSTWTNCSWPQKKKTHTQKNKKNKKTPKYPLWPISNITSSSWPHLSLWSHSKTYTSLWNHTLTDSVLQAQEKLSFPHHPHVLTLYEVYLRLTSMPWHIFFLLPKKLSPLLFPHVINLVNSHRFLRPLNRDDHWSGLSRLCFLCPSDMFPEYSL